MGEAVSTLTGVVGLCLPQNSVANAPPLDWLGTYRSWPAATSLGCHRLGLDHRRLQAGPLPVLGLADDVDVALGFVSDLVDLHPGQLLLKRLPQLVELRPVLGRHGTEQVVQRV